MSHIHLLLPVRASSFFPSFSPFFFSLPLTLPPPFPVCHAAAVDGPLTAIFLLPLFSFSFFSFPSALYARTTLFFPFSFLSYILPMLRFSQLSPVDFPTLSFTSVPVILISQHVHPRVCRLVFVLIVEHLGLSLLALVSFCCQIWYPFFPPAVRDFEAYLFPPSDFFTFWVPERIVFYSFFARSGLRSLYYYDIYSWISPLLDSFRPTPLAIVSA